MLPHPGYPFGSIAFLQALEAAGLRANIDIAETDSTYYAGHLAGPGKPGVRALKYRVLISALPASRTRHIRGVLELAIPVLEPMANIFGGGLPQHQPLPPRAGRALELGAHRTGHEARRCGVDGLGDTDRKANRWPDGRREGGHSECDRSAGLQQG